ncbi:MAG TPA: hypothetical protein VLH56_02810 [Dissulfurispiraceae bacterium]|nr:hypothetical protein [Dissulfurispiraceae bacterium]
MSQHDMEITTADANTGVTFRAQVNAALQALATNQSGTGNPAITYAYQTKIDTSASPAVVYLRKSDNASWVRWGYIHATTGQLIADNATNATDATNATNATNAGNANTVDNYHIDATGAANNDPVIFDVTNATLKKGTAAAAPAGAITSVEHKTGAYTLVNADKGKLITTSGTWTLSIAAISGLDANWHCWVHNSGTGTITIDPNASELVFVAGGVNAGETTITLPYSSTTIGPYNVSGVLLSVNAALTSFIAASSVEAHGRRVFTASGTFNVPAGVRTVWVSGAGGGGGGGGGGCGVDGGVSFGGTGGGPASSGIGTVLTVTPGDAITVTVAAAVSGGSGGTSGGAGAAGTAGGTTSFGGLVSWAGGAAGAGGANYAGSGNFQGYYGLSGNSNIFGGGGSGGCGAQTASIGATAGVGGSSYGGSGGGGGGGWNGTTATNGANGGGGAAGFVLVEW